MNRRAYLSAIGAGTVAITGCTALAKSDELATDEPNPEYYGRADVEMESNKLIIKAQPVSLRMGDQIRFRISNTGEETIHRGCHLPWALQRHSDGNWEHVAWTGEEYFDMCATELNPGATREVTLTIAESELRQRADDVRTPLRSGKYRFLLVGSSPYYGTDFNVHPAE